MLRHYFQLKIHKLTKTLELNKTIVILWSVRSITDLLWNLLICFLEDSQYIWLPLLTAANLQCWLSFLILLCYSELLISENELVLYTPHQPRCPSLDTLQKLNVLLEVRGPKLNTGLQVQPHQCWVQGHDHLPTPAGHAVPDTSQDAIGLLGHLGTLPAHGQPAVNQHRQVLFLRTAFQPLLPKPVALHGVVVTKVQDPAFGLVLPHTVGLGPSIWSVLMPLQGLPRSTLPPSLVSSANLLRAYSIPSSRSLIKMLNKTRPKTEEDPEASGVGPGQSVKSLNVPGQLVEYMP